MSGPRHPGTEGNDLWPADVKFPDPDGGDGRLSLVNDVAAEFSGLAISSTQPTDMPDGGLWINLSADATAVDRLSTYDESTDAFIPIQADSTVVQDSEPAHSKGLIWFDSSPEDGFDMFFSDGETWYFLQFISEIPDSVVDGLYAEDYDESLDEWNSPIESGTDAESTTGLVERTFPNGTPAVGADGSNHAVWQPTPLNFEDSYGGVAFTVNIEGSFGPYFLGWRSDGGEHFDIRWDRGDEDGKPSILIDDDSERIESYGDVDISGSDDSPYLVVINLDSDPSGHEWYIGQSKSNMETDVSQVANSGTLSDFGDRTEVGDGQKWGVGSRLRDGSYDSVPSPDTTDIGFVELNETSYTEEQRKEIFDRRPELD